MFHHIGWPDFGVPRDPVTLFQIIHSLSEWNLKCTLVHCSAGVGRTGTFLALYKLWTDYNNQQVDNLALLPTVVTLRKQRCLMVQKVVQYVYIAKCLSFMVSTEEGDYYEATTVETEKEKGKNKVSSSNGRTTTEDEGDYL